jgi:hypothetical protein
MKEWISVKDDLPLNHQNVLFITTEDRKVYPGYFVAPPSGSEESNFLGVFRIGFYPAKTIDLLTSTFNVWAHNQSEVSHWQPLPEAP